MSEYNNDGDLVTIIDDNGEEITLEYVEEMDYNGSTYVCFLPTDMDENDPDYGLIILRSILENGEEFFESVDDDAELDDVYNKFMVLLFDDEDEPEDADKAD